ncbi:MAG: DUF4190 domain-containing protein [Pirellulales bacterium]|nr:DUF4190 domain-containing protein [Pirellulales bacterium]
MNTVMIGGVAVAQDDAAGEIQYRALHVGALLSLVLGLLSIVVPLVAADSFEWCLLTAPIPLIGLFLGLRALATIRRMPEQYAGGGLALSGAVLSLLFLVAGVSYGGYVYATEVPEGYERTSFNAMKPDEIQERGGVRVPPEIMALQGKKVFIKGYLRPDSVSVQQGIDRFLLVRDNNQCCFGDLSKIKYYDQAYVVLKGDLRVNYSQGVYRMGGTLHIEPRNAATGAQLPVFSLEADYAKY